MKLKQHFERLLKDERGQSMTEYILILAVVVMVIMRFRTMFNKQMGDLMTTVGGKMQQAAQDSPE